VLYAAVSGRPRRVEGGSAAKIRREHKVRTPQVLKAFTITPALSSRPTAAPGSLSECGEHACGLGSATRCPDGALLLAITSDFCTCRWFWTMKSRRCPRPLGTRQPLPSGRLPLNTGTLEEGCWVRSALNPPFPPPIQCLGGLVREGVRSAQLER